MSTNRMLNEMGAAELIEMGEAMGALRESLLLLRWARRERNGVAELERRAMFYLQVAGDGQTAHPVCWVDAADYELLVRAREGFQELRREGGGVVREGADHENEPRLAELSAALNNCLIVADDAARAAHQADWAAVRSAIIPTHLSGAE